MIQNTSQTEETIREKDGEGKRQSDSKGWQCRKGITSKGQTYSMCEGRVKRNFCNKSVFPMANSKSNQQNTMGFSMIVLSLLYHIRTLTYTPFVCLKSVYNVVIIVLNKLTQHPMIFGSIYVYFQITGKTFRLNVFFAISFTLSSKRSQFKYWSNNS